MCGIGGIIYFNNQQVESTDLKKMNSKMKYRGPDDEGIFIEKNVGLSHVRLSIIDLSSAGHQPMYSSDERYVIVFNGEIYNYLEIKNELLEKYKFKSNSDTEVLLYAYIEYGQNCLEKLNGMFAFAIYDRKNNILFAARDRFGIKPFFYFKDENVFIFSSEINPILEIIGRQEENPQVIYDFLLFNRVSHTNNTFFNNIVKLNHAHCLEIKDNKISMRRYFDLIENKSKSFESSEQFLIDLNRAIDLTLRSDVPIGVSLSGGLDSSTLVSLIKKKNGFNDLHTFSAVYGHGEFGDESDYIQLYNNTIKNLHLTYPNETSLIEDLEIFVKALVEPIPGTSEYAEFCVMKLAKEHCTVVINGQGPDEQMGGYDYFSGIYWKELINRFKFIELIKEFYYSIKLKRFTSDLIYFLYFLSPAILRELFTPSPKKFINKKFLSNFKVSKEVNHKLYGSKSLYESFINHFEYKFEHHLQWADRSGMWFSLESRFPFLDHDFCKKVIKSSINQIRNQGKTKWIQREAVRGIVPDKIINRNDKVGYDTPENNWLKSKYFQKIMENVFNNPSPKLQNYLDLPNCKRSYFNFLNGNEKVNAREFWKWLNLDLWFKINFNSK